jgi:hypothetical protein
MKEIGEGLELELWRRAGLRRVKEISERKRFLENVYLKMCTSKNPYITSQIGLIPA